MDSDRSEPEGIVHLHTKNGIRRNRKYTVKPTQGQVKSLLTELLGGESSWL